MIGQAVEIRVPDEGFALAGHLEGSAATAADRPGAVVCHPHPAFGGTMETPLVVDLARALADVGLLVLRFDFRGVGGSGGRAEGGLAEQRDVRAACAFLRSHGEGGERPIVLAGYSFGALMAMKALALGERVVRFAGIAPPIDVLGDEGSRRAEVVTALRAARSLLIAGDGDQFCRADRLTRLAAEAPGARAEILPGVDHFPEGASRAHLIATVVEFLRG